MIRFIVLIVLVTVLSATPCERTGNVTDGSFRLIKCSFDIDDVYVKHEFWMVCSNCSASRIRHSYYWSQPPESLQVDILPVTEVCPASMINYQLLHNYLWHHRDPVTKAFPYTGTYTWTTQVKDGPIYAPTIKYVQNFTFEIKVPMLTSED